MTPAINFTHCFYLNYPNITENCRFIQCAESPVDLVFRKSRIKSIILFSRIIGRARSENIASIRVLEKLGMTFREIFDFEGHEGVVYEVWGEDLRK